MPSDPILLWDGVNVECHGGESNDSARRFFCPRTGKYAGLGGLHDLVNAKAFGLFHSGNGADPVIGGGTSGNVHAFDYVCGGPNLRMEHVHWIDVPGGARRLRVACYTHTKVYTGLTWQGNTIAANVDKFWHDSVYVTAYGLPVAGAGLPEWVNYPGPLLPRTGLTMAGEGQGSGTERAARFSPPNYNHKDSPWLGLAAALIVAGRNAIMPAADGRHGGANWGSTTGGNFHPSGAGTVGWGMGNAGEIGLIPHGQGLLNRGRTITNGSGTIDTTNGKIPQANDTGFVCFDIGTAHIKYSGQNATGFPGVLPLDLRVDGYQRIALAINSIAPAYEESGLAAGSRTIGITLADPPDLRHVIDGQIWAWFYD